MGLTGSALQIGKSALLSYQAALQVAGNNIANIGNPNYTRQSAQLEALPNSIGSTLSLGNGVQLGAIRRNISEAVEARLRQGRADRASSGSEDAGLQRIESILNALGDSNLGQRLEAFFGSFSELQNTPENAASRGIVLTHGTQLAEAIRSQRADLLGLRAEQNDEIESAVRRADEIATQIAELNVQVVAAEAGSSSPASALRDQRDSLLRELSETISVTTREQPTGALNVYIGNEPLVFFGESRGLQSVEAADANGELTVTVRFKVNQGPVDIRSGSIEGFVRVRDEHIDTQLARLDQLAKAVIFEVNKLHAAGQGLRGFSTVTSAAGVDDAALALNNKDAGLDFAPRSGSFFIEVTDSATGAKVRTQINVDLDGLNGDDTTLTSLAAQINGAVSGVTATVLPDGRLRLDGATGSDFRFVDDTSSTLAALGINTFFAGADSSDIVLNDVVAGNPDLIAASQSGLPGDGDNAGRIAALIDSGVDSLGGASVAAYYGASIGIHAVAGSAARSAVEASDAILSSLVAQRESVSGVSLDEESVKLVTYQRAFQGAARYLTVVDELLQTLLGLVR